jgi:hypothetical protein
MVARLQVDKPDRHGNVALFFERHGGLQMRRSYMIGIVAVTALAVSAMIVGAVQQRAADPGAGATPRRDMSGVWLGVAVPHLETPAPLTAAGAALFAAAKPMYGPRAVPVAASNDPLITCDPLGFPRGILHEMRGMEIVQSPTKIVQLLQYQRTFREIWTDGRSLPANVGGAGPESVDPRWYGFSAGRWLDDYTFVAETTGATETSWGDEYGHPHGLGARIEERYRRVDADTLELVVTIDDREMYQKPFVAMKLALKRGKQLEEQLCVPSEALRYYETVAKPAVDTP